MLEERKGPCSPGVTAPGELLLFLEPANLSRPLFFYVQGAREEIIDHLENVQKPYERGRRGETDRLHPAVFNTLL